MLFDFPLSFSLLSLSPSRFLCPCEQSSPPATRAPHRAAIPVSQGVRPAANQLLCAPPPLHASAHPAPACHAPSSPNRAATALDKSELYLRTVRPTGPDRPPVTSFSHKLININTNPFSFAHVLTPPREHHVHVCYHFHNHFQSIFT